MQEMRHGQGVCRVEKEWWPYVGPRKAYALSEASSFPSGLWEEHPSVRNNLVICLTYDFYVSLSPVLKDLRATGLACVAYYCLTSGT